MDQDERDNLDAGLIIDRLKFINKNIQIDDIQTKMASTGNTKYIIVSGKEKFYFWELHKGIPSPVFESYTGMKAVGLTKKGSVVAIGYTEEEESFVNKEGKTVNFTSRCIVGLREAGSGAEPTKTAPQAQKPSQSQNIASSEQSKGDDYWDKKAYKQCLWNFWLEKCTTLELTPVQRDAVWKVFKEIEQDAEMRFNPSPARTALERTNPNFFKKEEPTIQQDDEPPLEEPPF